jgi:anti-anti-sigma regulatory factor
LTDQRRELKEISVPTLVVHSDADQICPLASRRLTRRSGPRQRLRVEGSLYLEDAELLERICRDIQQDSRHAITLDLADLSFLDSDSAEVLARLKRERGVRLEGLHLFIQKVLELAEAAGDEE